MYLIHLERDGENGRKDQISVWFLVWDDLTETKLEFEDVSCNLVNC